ncbi:MAG: RNA 2',3'-cyclic phosphodiesterase [Gemmataceae bacterium]|jgi:2'-5' RNA ligase|nr:RNA 2',3'-cyclic phosphodiesterase [Gemmataceae bacterium]
MAKLRLFVAIDIPPAIQQAIVQLQSQFGLPAEQVRWVNAEENGYHLTLHFLGDVPELEMVAICRSLQKVTAKIKRFPITIEGVGGFPNLRRPKVLWVGVGSGTEELAELHRVTGEALSDLGRYRREERVYTPHITLGRLNPDADEQAWGKLLQKHADWQAGGFTISEVLVMASEARREGHFYTIMGRARLG